MTLSLFVGGAQSFAQVSNNDEKYLGYIYQQKEYQLEDPKGDLLLLWTAHNVPKFIKSRLTGAAHDFMVRKHEAIKSLIEKYPEIPLPDYKSNFVLTDHEPRDLSDEPIAIEGRKAPFKIRNVVKMMKQVMVEEFHHNQIVPKEGTIHEWSPTTHRELKNQFKLFARMPKLLVALAQGVTSRFMISGKEDQLIQYILVQPEKSINLEMMFRMSYRINEGDVYLSLLTIENVLSRYWTLPQRDKRIYTSKLKDITNYNYQGDKFGAWYHLFGIMLYGYAEGAFESYLVGKFETWGSQILSRFKPERQENFINKRGGRIGHRLRRFVKKEQYLSFQINSDYTQEDFYMDLDEDFGKRIKKHLKKR